MDDPDHQGTHTWDGIHPQEPYLSHQGRRVQRRVHRLHRIANDRECATKPLYHQLIHRRASLNPQLRSLLSAEGSSITRRVVETNEWYDGLYVTRLHGHDELGTHDTLEPKSRRPDWTSEKMTGMPQAEKTT
jgi:hypothetical protein